MRVVAFDSPLVRIEPFDVHTHPGFAAVLERLQSTMRFSAADAYAVVTNHADCAIEVLVMRWSMEEGSEARRKPKSAVHEGFSNPPYEPVLLPGASRLATGGGFFRDSLPERFVMLSGEWLGVYQVVEIDSAVFEDGRVVGPDRFGVVKHVRDRRAAVKELLSLVDEGRAAGRNIDDILATFDVTIGDTRNQMWRRMLVHSARRNHSFLDYLRRQRELPATFPR